MSDFLNLGFDAGMGALKLCGSRGGLEFLSQVSVNGSQQVARMAGLSHQKPPLVIERDGQSFYVGAGAHDWGRPVESLDYERLVGAPEMIALFCGALTHYAQQCGGLTAPLRAIVGLPVETLAGDAGQGNIAAVRRWLEGEHTWKADGQAYRIEVVEAKVTSQAAGALFDYLLNAEGKFIPERKGHFKGEVGIVCIGFNTVELLVVRGKAPVQRFTTGATVGVRRLLELINRQRLYSLGELDTLLRTGQLDASEALPVWEREVIGVIEKQWGASWRRFAAVLVVGGGAVLLRDSLTYRFNGRAIVPDDPVLSVARGLYKLGVLQQKKD